MATEERIIEVLKSHMVIPPNSSHGVIEEDCLPDVAKDISKLFDTDWKSLRNKFFKECTQKDTVDGQKVRIDYAPHDLFEWFKKELGK